MTTLMEIKDSLQRIDQELARVRVAVERLDGLHREHEGQQLSDEQSQATPSLPPEATPARWPASHRLVDKEPLRKTVDALFERLGIADVEPIGAEALQEQMRQHGINAEDNIFSRGIIEMREE